MKKTYSSALVSCLILASKANAILPIYPAEILGRDLAYPGMKHYGHVGIATVPSLYQDAYQIIEVLNDEPVIQTNLISDFKQRSKYWGSRYGISSRKWY